MTGTVLVVDDDEDVRRLLEMKLRMEGLTPVGACDGLAAVAAVEAGDFDLVILDVMMPGIDGIEACRRIREFRGEQLPILMLTARARPADIVMGVKAGATDYMVKPFSPRELSDRVMGLLTHETAA
jgi:DNA-binding response OmpR family regulator